MDFAYTYGDPLRLYLNVTNRCTNRCSFCVRNGVEGLGGKHLWGGEEPDRAALEETIRSLGGARAFAEFVWCGFGEPTFRLDLILGLSPLFRRAGAKVRLNTNGHGCLIHGRDILPELGPVLDEVSVSLNAPTKERYLDLCRPMIPPPPRADETAQPAPGTAQQAPADPGAAWEATIDFLRQAPDHVPRVQASVVGFTLSKDEIGASRALAASLGVTRFRVR